MDWRRPAGARALVVVAPAMGVRRQFYAPFLDYLADEGFASVIADYRGIGESRPADNDLKDWAEEDLESVLAAARGEGLPLLWLGHSVGGQLFGLLREPSVRGAVFVASQSGYWRNWPGGKKLAMWALWHAGIPFFVRTLGRLPMRLFGQGEDLPGRVAAQWAAWGRHPHYIQRYAQTVAPRAFQTYAGPLHSFAIADDGYAPPLSVRKLDAMYENAHIVEHLLPAPLGHFGPFRKQQKGKAWPRLRDALAAL